ncbi:MAG: hypothetical protein VKK04_05525 [Synechococcales bacterium]|nr:hypothetical protein [Synechococcales bacterium]
MGTLEPSLHWSFTSRSSGMSGANACQTGIIVAIAAVTTIFTTVTTSYLLNRPWCMQPQADGGYAIAYGANQCESLEQQRPSRSMVFQWEPGLQAPNDQL